MMKTTLIEWVKLHKLAILGFILPYITIILIAAIIIILPGKSVTEKLGQAAMMVILLPVSASIIGSILVGIYSIKRERNISPGKLHINAFIFSLIWTSVFHYWITLFFFMQYVYAFAGMKH